MEATTIPQIIRPTFWSRCQAAIYDPFLAVGEWSGMRRRRRALLAGATGRVLEVGAGTGLNVSLYPESVSELVLTEPEPAMRARLAQRVDEHAVTVLDAPAERLPFADGTFDTVVSTLVLCTVDAPRQALDEIARVLRPGGQFLFIEHVRADSRIRAFIQDRAEKPWRRFAAGCRCNRATLKAMQQCGFDVDAERSSWRGMPGIVRPLFAGRATLAWDR
jgi:ubiquinone/menaquinone biosynthesis C-methylase UbiE